MAKLRGIFIICGAIALSGCASAVNTSNQTSKLIVKGSESAYCEFKNDAYITKVGFNLTGTVNLERSSKPLMAECWGDQGRFVKMRLTPALAKETALNAGTGILPGLGYDMFAGGMWRWPDPILIDFRSIETDPGTPAVTWPSEETVDATDASAAEPLSEKALNPAQSIVPVDAIPLPPAEAAKYISSIGRLPVEATAKAPEKIATEKPKSKKMQPILSPEDMEKPKPKKRVQKKAAVKLAPVAEKPAEKLPETPAAAAPQEPVAPSAPTVPEPSVPAVETPTTPLLQVAPLPNTLDDMNNE